MLQRIQRSFAGRGPGEIAALAAKTIIHSARSMTPAAIAGRRRDAEFDRRWGTDTTGLVDLSKLSVDPVRARFGGRYQASDGEAVAQAVKTFGIDPRDWSFVDYGSGKGRIVLIAARLGFGRAVGVEFSPELSSIAEENGRLFTSNGGASISPEFVLADAGSYEPPEGPLFAYLYNSFGPPVIDEVAVRLAAKAAKGEQVLFAYFNPQHFDLFVSYGKWDVVQRDENLALLRSP
ncbi:MAG TPA: class I SAM-dependent methyltransferase [Allosphingosinicella sp.]|nr:class I SAM-dependent methyltransferase [Allosphingosinicella sp.]